MLAAFYEKQGPAREVIRYGELPTPQPGRGEVRVRVRVSGVNPSDWKTRKGGGGRKLAAPLIVPHSDGAGQIDAVGEGVPASRIGERVWIWNGQWQRAFGTAAQYIALPSSQAVRMPDNLDDLQGACLGIPALTAVEAVRLAQAGPGMTLLVQGGAGAVGQCAIQVGKARGAKVIATVSSDEKARHALAAGADHALDYKSGDLAERVRALTDGRGVDAVIEVNLTANAAAYPGLLKANGAVIIYGITGTEATLPALWMMQNAITLKFFMIYSIPAADREAGLAELNGLLHAGKLRQEIAMQLPLEQAAAAHDFVEQGHQIGNVVLLVP